MSSELNTPLKTEKSQDFMACDCSGIAYMSGFG